eukprot:1646782-Pleurochrysis_carterae.AAC.1
MMRDRKAAERKGWDRLSPGMRRLLERSQRSGTPKATVPSGMEADDASSPCRPRNLLSEWEKERRGPDLLVRTPEPPSP